MLLGITLHCTLTHTSVVLESLQANDFTLCRWFYKSLCKAFANYLCMSSFGFSIANCVNCIANDNMVPYRAPPFFQINLTISSLLHLQQTNDNISFHLVKSLK